MVSGYSPWNHFVYSLSLVNTRLSTSCWRESDPWPPHYQCDALPTEPQQLMKCEPSYVSQRIKVYHKISVVSIGKMYFLEIFCSFIHIAFPKGQGYNCYSSLVPFWVQIPCLHENLNSEGHEGSAILWAKMSCEAAESIEDALLRMARVNGNFFSIISSWHFVAFHVVSAYITCSFKYYV